MSTHSRPMSATESHHSHISDGSGVPMECMCQICVCGKHHCPVHPREGGGGRVCPPVCNDPLSSTYRTHYPIHEVTPARHRRETPTALSVQCPADHFVSTYRNNYLHHRMAHRAPKHRYTDMDYYPPMVPFDGTSTYRAEHYKKVPAPRLARERPPLPAKTLFDGTSTHRANFRAPPTTCYLPKREGNCNGEAMLKVPFDSVSTYGAEFVRQNGVVPPRRFAMPPADIALDDRDFGTSYARTFTKKPTTVCPAAVLPRERASSRHTGHIHYHRNEVMEASKPSV